MEVVGEALVGLLHADLGAQALQVGAELDSLVGKLYDNLVLICSNITFLSRESYLFVDRDVYKNWNVHLGRSNLHDFTRD